jgi:hypothetical protein
MAAMLAFGAAAYAATQEPMAAPTLPSPPLLPGEVFQTTANGCEEFYLPRNKGADEVKNAKWNGTCVAGLLQGVQTQQWTDKNGRLVSMSADYAFGREIEMTKVFSGEAFKRIYRYSLSGSSLGVDTVDTANLSSQDWNVLQSGMTWFIGDGSGTRFVILVSNSCYMDQKRYPRCTKENYRPGTDDVWMVIQSDTSSSSVEACPDGKVISSCGEILAPILNGLAARLEASKADSAAWKAQVNALYQNYVADYNRAQAAIAAAAAARQRTAEREARQAEAEFQSSLKTMGAGQLFAKADELRRAGQTDKSLQMLRALVSRFPNSPLAGTAAQQLSGMSGGSGGASSGSAPQYNGGGAAAAPGGSCHAKVMEDEARVRGYNVHVDAQGRPASSILLYQYVMYVLQQRLNVLDTYCKGQPEYAQRPSAQRTYDTAATNCAAISSTNTCPGPVMPPRM